MSPLATVSAAYHGLFSGKSPARLGIALSGGGDSTALLLLTRAALPATQLYAATVDHRLRDGSTAEAEQAGALCKSLGIAHEILPWEGWAGQGNLQDSARTARRSLLSDWAERNSLTHVALGHTRDDQAETVLMRLARGSGVDGLAAMSPATTSCSVTWLRPLLDVSRESLRDYLRDQGQSWTDDPSNEDPRFDRIRARAMANTLADLGLTHERLARTARQMALARDALNRTAAAQLRAHGSLQHGDVIFPIPPESEAPTEITLRILAHVLTWVASTPYRPRYDALTACFSGLKPGKSCTLHGCLITREGDAYRIAREYAAVEDEAVPANAIWDNRWRLSGLPSPPGSHIAALGETGLAECPDWRTTGLPRASVMASPALWIGDRLLAAPLAGYAQGYTVRLCHGVEHLVSTLLTH